MSELITLSAVELAKRIRARQISVSDVVEAYIRRIERVNPLINAVVTTTFDSAREQARVADQHLSTQGSESLPPLFGVPITIKDSFPVAGVRFTGGSWYRRDHISDEDAVAVKRLKDAGAIILGKTNLPDMCWAGETVNPVFGRTLNPHNTKRTVGGSSGGEGAIIAAGGSALGLGSDIAGSVRIPAAINGIVALKPTAKRISTAGHVPDGAGEHEPLAGWLTAGPMARRVEDLALALEVLSNTPTQDYRQIDLKDRPLGVVIENGLYAVGNDVRQTVMMAVGALRHAGMAVNFISGSPMRDAGFLYVSLLRKALGQEIKRALGGGTGYDLWDEVAANWRGEGKISPEVLFFTEYIDFMGRLANRLGYNRMEQLAVTRERFTEALGAGGVLLCPVIVTAPPRHGWTWWTLMSIPYTSMFNALGFPAVAVPIQYTHGGLPMVVQVVAQAGQDETALAVAAELERTFGGWRLAMPQ